MKCGRVDWQEAESTRDDFNIVLTRQDKKFLISELFKVTQDAILLILHCRTMFFSEQLLRVHLSKRMCNQFTLHHKFRIDTGTTKFEQKTDGCSFTSVDPMNEEHKDPNNIDLEAPCLAWYKQKKWRRHHDTVYWVDIQFVQLRGFKFYQTRSNAIILYDTLPACQIPKVIMMESGEIIHEKVYAPLRPPPHLVCLLRRSEKMSCLAAKAQTQERGDL